MMGSIERTIEVSFRHRVFFTERVFDPGNPLLAQLLKSGPDEPRARALVLLDESLYLAQRPLARQIEAYFHRHPEAAHLVAPPVVIEGGERLKNSYFHVSEIHSDMDRFGIDRHSYLLAVGGGALLDVAGLAAATAHRGVRHVRLPTTTLAQADSGVGVKNGINAFGKKNFIGTFAVPHAVINDFTLLETLSPRDKRAGYIEAVKVACIRDAAFFQALENEAAALKAFEPEPMKRLIHRCAELHVQHIATCGDPFELGSARPLDFGHWAAHKLEQLSEYRLRHGEAVAVGIALDVLYSQHAGLLSVAAADRILRLIQALGFDLFTPELLHREADGALCVLRGLEEFREHLGGRLTVTLLEDIGRGLEVHTMAASRVEDCIHELYRRFGKAQAGAARQRW